jgi:hypothetical protein
MEDFLKGLTGLENLIYLAKIAEKAERFDDMKRVSIDGLNDSCPHIMCARI